MRLDPRIAGLRGDDAPQRDAQQALGQAQARWSEAPQTQAIMADLARFADPDVALEDCAALSALFDGHGARSWVDDLVSALVAGLRAAPLGHVPLRHFTNGLTSSLLLGRAGETTLALVATDGSALAKAKRPASANFAPLESHEIVLSGCAEAELVGCDDTGAPHVALRQSRLALREGSRISREGARRALHLLTVEGCLVVLRLQRRPRHGGVAYEYDLASGRLIHRAAGVMRESRHALMVNLLGRMGRADAAPVLASIAQEDCAADLRWQALREGLGLDTAGGFAALARVAAQVDDPLAPPAAALKAQLLASYPALEELA